MASNILVFVVFSLTIITTGQGCRSGWSSWVNNHTASSDRMPDYVYGEGSGTGAGGDVEYMDYTEQNQFCPPNEGRITDIECVTDDEAELSYADVINLFYDEYGIQCDINYGLLCLNDQLLDNTTICDDFKIRYYCNCSGHEDPTTPAPTTAVAMETRTVTPNIGMYSAPTTNQHGSGVNNQQQCCRCDRSTATMVTVSLGAVVGVTMAALFLKL